MHVLSQPHFDIRNGKRDLPARQGVRPDETASTQRAHPFASIDISRRRKGVLLQRNSPCSDDHPTEIRIRRETGMSECMCARKKEKLNVLRSSRAPFREPTNAEPCNPPLSPPWLFASIGPRLSLAVALDSSLDLENYFS